MDELLPKVAAAVLIILLAMGLYYGARQDAVDRAQSGPKVGTAEYYQQTYNLAPDEYIGYDCLNGWLFAKQGNAGWLYVRDAEFKPIRCK